jgi:DNA invertase Pin-like site-specific DNA recombinase
MPTSLPTLFSGGKMDVSKILTELRQEREQIEEAIMSLERLARGRGRRRGRPPAWMTDMDKKRGRPPGSKNKNSNVQKAVGLA